MKGKALRKHSLHEKTAASVLLKPFISSNEWCHTWMNKALMKPEWSLNEAWMKPEWSLPVFESGLPVCGLFWVGRDDQCDGNLYLPVLVGGANLVRPSILLGYVCRQKNYIILK